jgi:hypothetical protein
MVIPVGLPGAQQLVVAEKDLNGRVTTKEIMPVLFSVLEESDQPAFPGVLIEMVADVSGREVASHFLGSLEAHREAEPPANALELLRLQNLFRNVLELRGLTRADETI